jgi:hypothetical protein
MPKKPEIGPFIYVGLVISVLLNVSGMASIVDGFVVWAGFFRGFVGLYRAWIRSPLQWLPGLIGIHLPGWVADWLCISGSFFLAMNLYHFQNQGETILRTVMHRPSVWARATLIVIVLSGPLIIPLLLILQHLIDRKGGRPKWDTIAYVYLYWVMVIGSIVVLMFLNWQLKRAGVW